MLRLLVSCSVLLMSLAVSDGWPEWGVRDNADSTSIALKIDEGDHVALKMDDGDSRALPVV